MLVDEELLISYVLHQTALGVDSKSGAFGGGAKFESLCVFFVVMMLQHFSLMEIQ